MSCATNFDEHIPLVRQLGRWLRNWQSRRAAVAELNRCGPDEVERVVRDVGVSGAELYILAGKWPDAADLLGRRMSYLNIDEAAVARTKPQAIKDLRRVCTLRASRRRCARDMREIPFRSGAGRVLPESDDACGSPR